MIWNSRWPPCPYMVKTIQMTSSPEPPGRFGWYFAGSIWGTYMWWPKFSNQEIYQIWSGVLIPYQEVFYRTILMRVKIYLKVKLQFHCPLYHIYPKYSDTASIVDQDQTDPKDCSRSALFASAFIKHSLIPRKELVQIWKWKSPLIYKNCSGVGIFREHGVTQVCVN